MANQLAYVGAIDKYDIDLFTAYAGALDATVTLPVRVSGANQKIAGNTLATQLAIGAVYENQLTLAALNAAVTTPITNGIAYLANTTGATGGSSSPGWVQWSGTAWVAIDIASSSGTVVYDSLTSGVFTAQVARMGGTACTISNPATGEYDITIPAGAHVLDVTCFANNTIVNGSNALIIRLNNAANARNRRAQIELFIAATGAQADVFNLGVVPDQDVAANITTITIPDFGGFGGTGAFVELR